MNNELRSTLETGAILVMVIHILSTSTATPIDTVTFLAVHVKYQILHIFGIQYKNNSSGVVSYYY